ncbi:MAG TPA: 2-C-methyl-D-erythritol 4-phosphate cytidylyltransferase [Atribacteraceae bacterium]|nr:2-C-methyl-D-erythritol 4-phosphate cytidylyltransferase [Atribacteraceae bacterium]
MFHAVIVAAGTGERLDSIVPKQYIPVLGKPLLAYTLYAFDRFSPIQDIVVVINPRHEKLFASTVLGKYRFSKRLRVVHGGDSRQESVGKGIDALTCVENEFVFIHDGVRPFVDEDILNRCAKAVEIHNAVCCALPCVDTIKITRDGKTIDHSLDRKVVWRAQTPQVFRVSLILEAFRKAIAEGYTATDDSSLVEWMGKPVYLVPGSEENFKITTAGDFLRAEELIRWKTT